MFFFWKGVVSVVSLFPTCPTSPVISLEGKRIAVNSRAQNKPAYLFSRVLNRSTRVLSFKQSAFVYTKHTLLYSSILKKWSIFNHLSHLIPACQPSSHKGKKRESWNISFVATWVPFRLLHTNSLQCWSSDGTIGSFKTQRPSFPSPSCLTCLSVPKWFHKRAMDQHCWDRNAELFPSLRFDSDPWSSAPDLIEHWPKKIRTVVQTP